VKITVSVTHDVGGRQNAGVASLPLRWVEMHDALCAVHMLCVQRLREPFVDGQDRRLFEELLKQTKQWAEAND
jgi:hypothetical protein